MGLNVCLLDMMKLLCEAKDIGDRYDGNAYFLQDQPPGVQYLFERFLRPIIHEGAYSIGELDLDQFDRDELESLWELYRDQIGPESDAWQMAERVYSVCSDAPSRPHTVAFL